MTEPTSQSIEELVGTAVGELEAIDDLESLERWRRLRSEACAWRARPPIARLSLPPS